MAEVNPSLIAKKDFDEMINLANKQANKFKDNPVKAKKYTNAALELRSAKTKLETLIDKTKNEFKVNDGSGGEMSFYDKYVTGKENVATIEWLTDLIATHESEIVSGAPVYDAEVNEINTHYDFIDATKKVGHDMLNGKGLSKALVGATIGVGVSELLAKGVTSVLAKEGIVQSSMGLFGLAKLGIKSLPAGLSALGSGMSMLWGFSPVAVVAGGALVALKAVPAIKRLVEKAVTKFKSNTAENNLFEDEANRKIAENVIS